MGIKKSAGGSSMYTKNKNRSMTEGPLFWKIAFFTVPIMLTGILQTLYGMADNIVVGRFSGDPEALAAVGSTGTTVNMILALVMGVAAGSGVIVAQLYGARRHGEVSLAVHTALMFSAICGVAIAIAFMPLTRGILELVGIREEIIDKSALYLRIVCTGFPALTVFNFGASILRAVGDSKTPLIILTVSGLTNILFNLLFVIVFKMSVSGVAFATIISQYVSAVWVVTVLGLRKDECYAFSFKRLGINLQLLWRMLRTGIPIGVQSLMFGVTNVLTTGAVNTFPTSTVTASTISGSIDSFTYVAMNSFQQAAMTFAGQNYGANKYSRIKKVMLYSIIQVTVVGIAIAQLELLFSEQLTSLFVDALDPNRELVVKTTGEIMVCVLSLYFLCGIFEALSGAFRGIGYTIAPTIITLVCMCLFRVLWILFVFPSESFNSISGLYALYPVSWTICLIAYAVWYIVSIRKKLSAKAQDTK